MSPLSSSPASGAARARARAVGLLLGLLLAGTAVLATPGEDVAAVWQTPDGRIHADGQTFGSWADYVQSDYFETHGKRCGTEQRLATIVKTAPAGSTNDCSLSVTNPSAEYAPQVARYRITVVVHVIQSESGQGFLSESRIQSQIDILNEDFQALLGSNGENGTNVELEFVLADRDPDGQPTNGITYSTNDAWYNDSVAYWDTLAWDTTRYLNIYTNTASGNLGYVPSLPNGSGIVGSNVDRVVVLWESFGRNGSIGPPYNQGRTATHEVGHYLGLDHTFGNGCGSDSLCYTTGDLICDTEPQSEPTQGCLDAESCGDPDPIDNYMDYSADLCMERFTPEQARRMRCTLLNWRPSLAAVVPLDCGNGVLNPGEDCDDGNVSPGDGCDAYCISEVNDCCATDHGPGCSSGAIESCVCALDTYCCSTDWDDLCVANVNQYGCSFCSDDGLPLEIAPSDASTPLRFTSSTILNWEADERSGAVLYNLYRGAIQDVPLGDYGACFYAGLSNNGALDPGLPAPGSGFSYLVTGTNASGEGPLGYQSSGEPRVNGAPCGARLPLRSSPSPRLRQSH